MSEIERIAVQLRRAHEGGAWHGPALEELLEDVRPEAAGRRIKGGAHNIWEILLHIGVWESIVRRRLSGEVVMKITAEQDWPPVEEFSAAAWEHAKQDVRRGYEQLQQAIQRLTDRQLNEPVPGMNYDAYAMLHGLVQHTIYHVGQIATLKRLES